MYSLRYGSHAILRCKAYDHVYICNLGLFATMPGPVAFSQVLKEEGSKLFRSSTETFIAEMLRIVL